MEPKRILVSGGWGYGNIGDEAILFSTLLLLRQKYSYAEICVMTFDKDETMKHIVDIDKVYFEESVHRSLIGNLFYPRYIPPNINLESEYNRGKIGSLLMKVNRRIMKISELQVKKKFSNFIDNIEHLPQRASFEKADLFVLAGGGYFNEDWMESFYSHILELELAKKLNIKTLIIGQSIGPISKEENKKIFLRAIQGVSKVSVRDEVSVKELFSLGVNSLLIPDTALSQIDFNEKKEQEITFVAGGDGLTRQQIIIITDVLRDISLLKNYKIKIIVSRTWVGDVRNAYKVYDVLKGSDLEVKIIVPKTLQSLQKELAISKVVISQNLHGLILSWRAGAPVVSINAGRKFKAFMEQSSQSTRIFSVDAITRESLSNSILDAIDDIDKIGNIILGLAENIKLDTYKSLDSIFKC